MGLNISKGNMYPFVSHTFNIIKGKCPHGCSYCFMGQDRLNDVRFDEQELKTDLGKGRFIFVGSSCDMWAELIPSGWIIGVMDHVKMYDNEYLLQTKNPRRMMGFLQLGLIPPKTVLGTTIETNRIVEDISKAPTPESR